MTPDERLMLVQQGAADPELAGCDVHRPADPRDAEIAAYRSALTEITQQKLCDELTRAEYDHADFEGAYDAIIKVARAALAQPGVTS